MHPSLAAKLKDKLHYDGQETSQYIQQIKGLFQFQILSITKAKCEIHERNQ